MERRGFLRAISAGALGAGGSLLAAPAIAGERRRIEWRLASSFPRSLDVLWGAAETLAAAVGEATDGDFVIRPYAAGELVPGLDAVDAVTGGTVEIAHSSSHYLIHRDPVFAWGSGVPFGLNTRQAKAWFQHGDGARLLDEFYAGHGLTVLPGGSTGAQMGGWFRKEIHALVDLVGLRIRIGGLGGRVFARLGARPQTLAADEICSALDHNLVDGAEWIGPYDDERLGLGRAAPFYYYPGWWSGGSSMQFFIDRAKWEGLPASHRSILRSAAARVDAEVQAGYDAANPAALKRLLQAGIRLRPFPVEVMEVAHRATQELYAEIGRDNPTFRRFHDATMAFRNDAYLWWQVAEFGYDAFMIRSRGR
jgi:TRAP-type mannitol/chloroaromatic compound transport system substrate-binding protein